MRAIFILAAAFLGWILVFWMHGHLWPAALRAKAELHLTPEDLVGIWQGKESAGTTFLIIRRADGTFNELTDYTHHSAGYTSTGSGRIVRSEGHWSLHGDRYEVHTRSTYASLVQAGPWSVQITPRTHTEFGYMADAGNGTVEKKVN